MRLENISYLQFISTTVYFSASALPPEATAAADGDGKTRDIVFNEWMLANKVSKIDTSYRLEMF